MTTDRITLWFARTGPCWCSGRPGASGSHDLERLRRTSVRRTPLLDTDVLMTPALVTPALLSKVRALFDRPDVLSVVYPLCPNAASVMPRDLREVLEEGEHPSITVDECVSGYPESLVVAMVEYLSEARTGSGRQRPPLAGAMGH